MAAKKKAPSKRGKKMGPAAPTRRRRRKTKRITDNLLKRALEALRGAKIVGAAPLARELKVPRATACVLLDTLVDKGFLATTGKERKRYAVVKDAPVEAEPHPRPAIGKAADPLTDTAIESLSGSLRVAADALQSLPDLLRRAALVVDEIQTMEKRITGVMKAVARG